MGRVGVHDHARTVNSLVRLFIIQLTQGCGSDRCIAQTCYTYRKRNVDRPLRQWTDLSARAAAFHLASLPDAVELLCHDAGGSGLLKVPEEEQPSLEQSVVDAVHSPRSLETSKKDPKSMSQLMFDTKSMRDFLNGVMPENQTALQTSLDLFDEKLDVFLSRLSSEPREALILLAVDDLLFAIRLMGELALHRIPSMGTTWDKYKANPRRLLIGENHDVVMRMSSKLAAVLVDLYSAHVHPAYHPAYHPGYNHETVDAVHERLVTVLKRDDLQTRWPPIRTGTASKQAQADAWFDKGLVQSQLVLMFGALFLEHWNGQASFSRQTPAGHALLALSWFERRFGLELAVEVLAPVLTTISSRTEPVEVAITSEAENAEHIYLHSFPWLFSPSQQAIMFRTRCLRQMETAIGEAKLVRSMASHRASIDELDTQVEELIRIPLREVSSVIFAFTAYRETVLEDAFDAIWRRQRRELLRPLRIELVGAYDIGQDMGGVAQEFFNLCWAQALDPAYGIFTTDETSRMAWFRPYSAEPPCKFELLGILFAMAIYNGFMLPVTFPLALYKHLLHKEVTTIEDIGDGWPEIAKGLTELRDWDETNGTVEDIFGLTYDFSFRPFDKVITVMGDTAFASRAHLPLKQDYHGPSVTSENRVAYISTYIRWLTYNSISHQLTAFTEGFHSILSYPAPLSLTPHALQDLVEGSTSSSLSIERLKQYTNYAGGYSPTDQTVQDFWRVANTWSHERKRQFLVFVTSSERLPVSGEKGIGFEIVRRKIDLEVDENGYGMPQDSDEMLSAIALLDASLVPEDTNTDADAIGTDATSPLNTTPHSTHSPSPPSTDPPPRTRYVPLHPPSPPRTRNNTKHLPLPTSNACFARLNLPDYEDEDVLREKLETALELGWKGFGLA